MVVEKYIRDRKNQQTMWRITYLYRNFVDNKWIPVICGVAGIVLGIVTLAIGMPDFPATDYLTAAAVGGASGLAATGIDQAVKQLKK